MTAPSWRPTPSTVDTRRSSGALEIGPEAIVAEIEASGLRGRGGAAYPTGRKLRTVLSAVDDQKYVVCNADEGDPGAYIDRFLLEGDPHAILEGMAIAAAAVGATRGYVYVRKEYPEARGAVARAIDEARTAGILGERLLGRGSAFDVEIVDGEGSYVCGEETALLNAIEGRRPEVRARPPFPAEHGLHGHPTLVDNVETLAVLPWILRQGGAAYAGARPRHEPRDQGRVAQFAVRPTGPLRGRVRRARVGDRRRPRRRAHDRTAARRPHRRSARRASSRPASSTRPSRSTSSASSVPTSATEASSPSMTHTSIAELVHHVFRFGAFESCGKCTPCRVGSRRIEDLFAAVVRGDRASVDASAGWDDVIDALAATSLCGHGTGLAEFARSVVGHFGEELTECFA